MEFSRVKKLDKQGSGMELCSGRYPRGKQHNGDGKTPMCDSSVGSVGVFGLSAPNAEGLACGPPF